MLKRIFLSLLVSMTLAMPLAQAETTPVPQTRQETIILEGMEEQINTTKFESALGYSLWYDSQIIIPVQLEAPSPTDSFTSADLKIPADANADGENISDVSLDIYYESTPDYSFDDAKKVHEKQQMETYGEIGQIEESGLFSAYPHQGYYANQYGKTTISYVIDQGEGAFYIFFSYPTEWAEGVGDRINQMLESFEMTPNEN